MNKFWRQGDREVKQSIFEETSTKNLSLIKMMPFRKANVAKPWPTGRGEALSTGRTSPKTEAGSSPSTSSPMTSSSSWLDFGPAPGHTTTRPCGPKSRPAICRLAQATHRPPAELHRKPRLVQRVRPHRRRRRSLQTDRTSDRHLAWANTTRPCGPTSRLTIWPFLFFDQFYLLTLFIFDQFYLINPFYVLTNFILFYPFYIFNQF